MKEKSTPIICKILSCLSGVNLIVMSLCVIFTVSAQQSLVANGLFSGVIAGPLPEMLINHLVRSMSGLTWIFVVVNIIISMVLLVAALIIRQSKNTAFNPVRRSPAVYGS
ncbi:MAG: hypothetical protein IH585_09480 [Anaerolineaceae bacterium]|nr:hypothetical protein [Anaerolineaceae bacterium]